VHYEIPGGVADHGTPLESAQQELLEETGYAGGEWSSLMTLSANPGLQTNLTHVFLAQGVEKVADPALEITEDLRVHLVPAADVAALIDRGEMIQAMHTAPLLRYLLLAR
jgi:8-oxo-dGTP pyrophosphatase MutT (NUDIX family)